MDEFRQGPPKNPEIRISREAPLESDSPIARDGEEDSYRASFDDGIDSVPLAVISTVAAVADTPPEELPPLQSVIDTDALDALFQRGSIHELRFIYYGYTVVIHGDEVIELSKDNK